MEMENLIKALEQACEEVDARIEKKVSKDYFDYDLTCEYHAKNSFSTRARQLIMDVRRNYEEITKNINN